MRSLNLLRVLGVAVLVLFLGSRATAGPVRNLIEKVRDRRAANHATTTVDVHVSRQTGSSAIPPCGCGCMVTGNCQCKNCCERTADPNWQRPTFVVPACKNGNCPLPKR